MGNLDKWSTPKQIKIEREGEPQGVRRGPLKKGERRKGKKARMDEILASFKRAKEYKKWIIEDRERRKKHPEWGDGIFGWHDGWFEREKIKLDQLVTRAVFDNILTANEGSQFIVERP